MKTPSPLAKVALRALADAPLEIEPPSARDAEDAIAAIARELDAQRARKRRQRTGAVVVGALAVAAAIAIAIGFVGRPKQEPTAAAVEKVSGSVLLVRGNEGATLATGSPIAKGDRVVASASGTATLRLRKGTELRALDGTDLLVAESGVSQIFDLRAGAVRLAVTKLESGERFIVRTTDAEVEVRGTAFEVRVDPNAEHAPHGLCSSTTTRVSVTEGTVVVRHRGQETRVTASESWPAGCLAETRAEPAPTTAAITAPASANAVAPVVTPTVPARIEPRPESKPESSATTKAPPPIASSELAEQNRLFAEAMAAKRQGNNVASLAALDRLIANHPQSPLAESAAVERMRILAASDPTRGAEAARAYLARHPKGYARDEAKKLASP